MNNPGSKAPPRRPTGAIVEAGLRRRYAAERRFRLYGVAAVSTAVLFLVILFFAIVANGYTAFSQTMLRLDITIAPRDIAADGNVTQEAIWTADYRTIVRTAVFDLFPEVQSRADRAKLMDMVSPGAPYRLRGEVLKNPNSIGKRVSYWVPVSDDMDQFHKGYVTADVPEDSRRVSDRQIAWFKHLRDQGRVAGKFNAAFFTAGDSRDPELAGIWGAALGSFYTLVVTLALAFPLGVAAALYLEEFAPKNPWTDLIEVNINNLAAVPSIVFGLLGLAVFLNFFSLPRSASLVGGIVLALMTLPTVIIAARAALQSVPPSIKQAALGIGASPMQAVLHHQLPLALPGILTGTIIGMARALGETAPLLMIGMVAFIVDPPRGFTDPATVLPVQIYLWSDSPERAFVERTSAAIMVLLVILVGMNSLAVYLRRRFERRW